MNNPTIYLYSMILNKKFVLCFISLLGMFGAFAQEEDLLDTEVVNVVKPYTPTVSDAFKVKETPVLNDSVTAQKKSVTYEIFSVPVASTFTPAKGKAETLEKAKPTKLYNNYATLGFGNYKTILGELFSNFEISRTDNAGFFFKHNSSFGEIDGILVDNHYLDTKLSGNYTSRQKDLSYILDAGVQHQVFNWYGLPQSFENLPAETINDLDVQQNYFGANLGGSLSVEESVFEKASAELNYFGDAYASSEIQVALDAGLRFPLTDFDFTVTGGLDVVSGSFEKGYLTNNGLEYGFMNAGVNPSLVYVNEDLSVALGAQAVVGLDLQNSTTDFFIYPQIHASYRLVDKILIIYGGAEGGLHQNTYRTQKEENPFISPTLFLTPTSELYTGYAGLKGKLTQQVGYNLRGSYGKKENMPFFLKNQESVASLSREGYEYGNSFGLIYDDVNILYLFGELKVEISNDFRISAQAEFYNYSLDIQPEAWNLPNLEVTVQSQVKITQQIYAGASVFFAGERKDIAMGQSVTLDSFLDANVNVGYRLNERLSIFAKGSNLLGKNYERWLQFPVQGIQGLLGATYKFDW